MAAEIYRQNRDLQLASGVQEMIRLRRFDQTFAVYGSCFYADQQTYFIISDEENKIADFLYDPQQYPCCPVSCQSLTEHFPVPAGFEEEALNHVKLHLAQQLYHSFPQEYISALYHFAQNYGDNQAADLLAYWQAQLLGLFNEAQLALFEGAVRFAYRRKNLTLPVYQTFCHWLNQERQEMADDIVIKDIFEKTFYGIAYLTEDGHRKIFYNTNRALVWQRMEQAQQKQLITTMPVKKTYWYNYTYRLIHVRQDCQHYYETLFNAAYFKALHTLYHLKPAVPPADYARFCQETLPLGTAAVENNAYYQNIWGLHSILT